MKFYIVFTIANIGLSILSFSQETSPAVVAAGGGTAKTSTLILDWTLGELAIESIRSPKALYTQGFHQPVLVVEQIKDKTDLPVKNYNVSVYPNPVTSLLYIQLHFIPVTRLSVVLRDGRGRLLQKKEIPAKSNSLQLNVSGYAQGAYHLQIQHSDGSILSHYNVIKAQ